MCLRASTGTFSAASTGIERLFPQRRTRANARRGVARLIGQSEARTRRKTQQVMRQSEWIRTELHESGWETYDEPMRSEWSESKARSKRTGCDSAELSPW